MLLGRASWTLAVGTQRFAMHLTVLHPGHPVHMPSVMAAHSKSCTRMAVNMPWALQAAYSNACHTDSKDHQLSSPCTDESMRSWDAEGNTSGH